MFIFSTAQCYFTLVVPILILLFLMLMAGSTASGTVDNIPDNYGGSNGTCLLSTPSVYLSHSSFVPMNVKYVWPPSRWENAGSLLVCVHMYQTQHVFPLSEARYPVCVCVADHTGRLTSRNPCSKNRHCVFPALMHRYHRTHTHAHTWIITLFSFPLQVSSTPILLPPAIKMFRCDCHERTCSSGTNRRTQTGEE